ncbi:MAG: response regulator transcription factor [Candidatus Bipolaricaulota bacterium]|nr:MAG: response regulator transcription factor [Candidatus Bipolaricaulota bacterium]
MTTRLIIVDDHAVVRDAIARLLEAETDLEVVGTAEDGSRGIALARETRPDVVLLDISLPDGDGLDLIAAFRRLRPSARVIMLSMHSEPEYALVATQRGASGLVAKSESPSAFIDAIRCVAAGGEIGVECPLTRREREVLAHIARGQTNAEIADTLALQPKTVEGYCQALMDRLDIHTRVGLVRYARRIGL